MTDNFKWNKESENSIYDAINDWQYHEFACIMKDGSLKRFSGMWDENCEGERTLYIERTAKTVYEAINPKCHVSAEDIVLWIEIPREEIIKL